MKLTTPSLEFMFDSDLRNCLLFEDMKFTFRDGASEFVRH